MCLRLAEFLRDSLTLGGEQRITLGREVGLAEQYLSVERVRFGPRLQVTTEIAPEAAAVTVPSELGSTLDEAADRLRPALRGGPVYTDDRAPVEWLVDLSLADVATGKGG
jgi:hypothetical protein